MIRWFVLSAIPLPAKRAIPGAGIAVSGRLRCAEAPVVAERGFIKAWRMVRFLS